LTFPLSIQDIEEGVVRWDYQYPYLNVRKPDGFCIHRGAKHECSVYQQRPVACRGYDCRSDRRIWLDFEKGVLSPEAERVLVGEPPATP
jgi:hypothetical protein